MLIWRLSLFLTVSIIYCNALPSFNNNKMKSVGHTVHTRMNEFRHHLNGIKRMMGKDQNEPQNTVELHTNHAKDMNLKVHEKGQDHRHKLQHRQNSPGDTKNNAIFGNEFRNKTVLAVAEAIFGVCLSYFGARQVLTIVK